MKILSAGILSALLLVAPCTNAQEAVPTDSATAETEAQKKAKEAAEGQAYAVLDQIVSDSQLLKLTENRVRVQTSVADLLWNGNEGRSRTLFALAADGVAELQRASESARLQRNANAPVIVTGNRNDRFDFEAGRTAQQLRQELILSVARRDATLAYQLLAVTRPSPSPTSGNANVADGRGDDLEERLLSQVAALDPKLALQNAEQYLDKGEFPRTLAQVLSELRHKDKDAAQRLEEKMLKKLRAANLLSATDASSLAFNLLIPGPRPSDAKADFPSTSQQVLAQVAYDDLLGLVIDAALKATPAANTQAGNQGSNQRNRGRGNSGGFDRNQQSQPTDEQANARRLLSGMRMLLPQIDQYLSARSAAVRQKLTDFGMSADATTIRSTATVMGQGTSEALAAAATSVPPAMQPRIYLQAAFKALEEGKYELARQLANDHLQGVQRDSVLRNVDARQLVAKAGSSNIDEVRAKLASLATDDLRIDFLLQLATSTREKNPELALQVVDEARQLTNRRATSYQQLEQQLRVAAGFRGLDNARSFEALEPGILQLNELLSAASVLNGFEVNVFRGGELSMQGGSGLTNMVQRYSQEIGRLAVTDFERAQMLANRFQFTESRIVARLSIGRALLGAESPSNDRQFRTRGLGGGRFNRNEQ